MPKVNPTYKLPSGWNREEARREVGTSYPIYFAWQKDKNQQGLRKLTELSTPTNLEKQGRLLVLVRSCYISHTWLLNFLVDYEHYLAQQVLPPVERLCDPIEGTERARLAECLGWYFIAILRSLIHNRHSLGLDPMRYQQTAGSGDRIFSALDSQISDSERFREAAPFIVRCRHCQGKLSFLPLHDPEVG
jgi:hypothetical protein